MVGTVGAVRPLPVIHTSVGDVPAAALSRAADYAFVLTAAWAKKEREPFEQMMKDLQAAAEHNAALYDQVAQAQKELSHRDKEARDLAEQAQAAHDGAMTLKHTTEREAADARAMVANDRRELAAQVWAFDEAARERERSIEEREKAVTLRESDADARQADLARRTELAEREAKEAASVKGRYLAALADLRAVIAKYA